MIGLNLNALYLINPNSRHTFGDNVILTTNVRRFENSRFVHIKENVRSGTGGSFSRFCRKACVRGL